LIVFNGDLGDIVAEGEQQVNDCCAKIIR